MTELRSSTSMNINVGLIYQLTMMFSVANRAKSNRLLYTRDAPKTRDPGRLTIKG